MVKFEEVVSLENILNAWNLFKQGKTKRYDLQEFSRNLETNIFELHRELVSENYKHSAYTSFYINDPKPRHIRKAFVRDRLVHQLIFTALNSVYEKKIIEHVYSSRIGKGTHKAILDLRVMLMKESKNLARTCWGLKCDIKKFYDSVDHKILANLISPRIKDKRVLNLIWEIIASFCVENKIGKGVPIGNLTSQIFTNIYLNELDQFIKHKLKVRFYLRYADDLLLLSSNKSQLLLHLNEINSFLEENLKLSLNPHKVSLRAFKNGIDFVGFVVKPYHVELRNSTKRRMWRKLDKKFIENECFEFEQTLQSYLGLLSHANTKILTKCLKNLYYKV
jgi:retron-type reverse transcriptase